MGRLGRFLLSSYSVLIFDCFVLNSLLIFYRMPPRRKGKNPVQPTPSQGGDNEPEGGDHSGLLSAMNKMMKSFFLGIIKGP